MVRVDSTGPHNRFLLAGHGEICERVLDLIDVALDGVPPNHLVVVALHHHLVPLPTETLPEWVVTQLGWPWASELRLGRELLTRLRGRCDLVLHGHRHVPREIGVYHSLARPLKLFNAGSSTALERFRVFSHVAGACWWAIRSGWFTQSVTPMVTHYAEVREMASPVFCCSPAASVRPLRLLHVVQPASSCRHLREPVLRPNATSGISIPAAAAVSTTSWSATWSALPRSPTRAMSSSLGVRSTGVTPIRWALAAARRWPSRVRVVLQRGEPGLNPGSTSWSHWPRRRATRLSW